MVRPGAALADVGTDHAYLPVWLAKSGRITRAVASDVRPGPLERARQNIEKYNVNDLVETRLCDGLDRIKSEETDDVVIAGMGGLMIAEIIGRTGWLKSTEKHLILQPMTREENLRRSLSERGFSILREQAVLEENHVYTVMLCAWDSCGNTQTELFPYLGLLNAESPENRAYLRRERKRLLNHANGFVACGNEKGASELFRLRDEIGRMLTAKEPQLEE